MQTNNRPSPDQDTLTLDHLRQWHDMALEARRQSLTIEVFLGHEGDNVLVYRDPRTGGQIARMSHRQAQTIHEEAAPLRLAEIVSPERARFRMAVPWLGEFVPKILPPPPYEVVPREDEGATG